MGSIPWVIMQLLLVAIVIFVPQTVTMFLPKAEVIDVDKVQIEVPVDDMRSEESSGGENPFGDTPAAPAEPAAAPAPAAAAEPAK
jgi:hypothetical protein